MHQKATIIKYKNQFLLHKKYQKKKRKKEKNLYKMYYTCIYIYKQISLSFE